MVSRTNHRYGLLVIGIMLLAVACSTSTPVASQPPPTATVILTDTATPTDVPVSTSTVPPAIPGCPGIFTLPPGQGDLPPTIPLPPHTVVAIPQGINAGSVMYGLCTPSATQETITQFMNTSLPAAGWITTGIRACNAGPNGYQWYKGVDGISLSFGTQSPSPYWALVVCPHVGG